MRKAVLAIITVGMLYGCSQDDGKRDEAVVEDAPPMEFEDEASTDPEPEPEPSETRIEVQVSFRCDQLGEDEVGTPVTNVILELGGAEMSIDTVSGAAIIEESEFSNNEMPDSALAACGGWWAGYGEYFFAVRTRNTIIVYKGSQDEGDPDGGYQYKVFFTKELVSE